MYGAGALYPVRQLMPICAQISRPRCSEPSRASIPRVIRKCANAGVRLHQPVASKTIRSWTELIGEHIRKAW
jgi:hypothetical protein